MIPLIRSDLLLKSSAVTSINVERIIKQVATASIVGLIVLLILSTFELVLLCYLVLLEIKQQQLHQMMTKAKRPPDITPGKIRGKVIFINVLTGSLPRLAAALVTLWSNPDKVAVTVITTNGVPKTIKSTIPV